MTELPTLPTTVAELLSTVTVPLERRPDGGRRLFPARP